jgi:fatty acid desaturase
MTAVSAPSARPPRSPNAVTQTFTTLARATRSLGLQDRTRWFYLLLFTGLVMALGGAVTGLILLGESWLQLLIAGALGLIFTQFAFLGHEASHRQVLASGPANDRVGRMLATMFVGISYSWWMNKHSRHHANPNKIGKDPDIEIDTVSFLPESADPARLDGLDNPSAGLPVLPAAAAGGSQPPRALIPGSVNPP